MLKCIRKCKPVCESPVPKRELFYAQYGVNAHPAAGEYLSFFEMFNEGSKILLRDEETIVLPAGHLYQISYVFQATVEEGNYFQILPFLDDTPGLLYAFYAPAGAGRNASASAGFITNRALEQAAVLRFLVAYPEELCWIDLSGSVSITPYL